MNDTVPEVRFKGFSGYWEEKRLGDVSKIYDGTHQTPRYTNSGIRFISVENIDDIYNTSKYISQEDFQNQFKVYAKKGDIFMTRITAGVIGATAIMEYDIPLAYYVSLALLKPNFDLVETLFLNANLQSPMFKKELNKRIIHTAFPKKINLGDIGECKISNTSFKEQQKIGSFFKKLDDIIVKQQKLVEQQQQYKMAFLQKMFPQIGEREPKIRFKEFHGKWRKTIIGNVLKEYIEKSTVEDEFDLLSSTNNGIEKRNGRVSGTSNIGYKIIREGNIVLSPQNLWLGNINYNSNYEIGIVSPSYKTFNIINSDNDFIAQYLRLPIMFNKYEQSSLQGASIVRRNLDIDLFNQIPIFLPTIEEQKKIGAFFKQLDESIAVHKKRLEEFKQMKKSFLKRMFVQ